MCVHVRASACACMQSECICSSLCGLYLCICTSLTNVLCVFTLDLLLPYFIICAVTYDLFNHVMCSFTNDLHYPWEVSPSCCFTVENDNPQIHQ